MRQIIEAKLREIEAHEDVTILLAVESGSRAWGFASPDSDYDVRFIYVRSPQAYLALQPVRDVIEWQLDDTLDISGWDLRKALILSYQSNPTLYEWLASPIVYRQTANFPALYQALTANFSAKKLVNHYLSMARQNYRGYLQGDQVNAKKYFYVLRPILAANWIIDHHQPAPITFDTLVKDQLPPSLNQEVTRLLQIKQELDEAGTIQRVDVINDYIESELAVIGGKVKSLSDSQRSWQALEHYFLETLVALGLSLNA